MAQTTYGSITLVDLTDVGQLSVYPTSNMPLSIIYDPDQNIYTPNWGTTNLTLTPVIYYNNKQLTTATAGVTVTWKRREGTGNVTALTTGETIQTNGNLKVTVNKFTPTSSMISYIVTASYKEPETQTTLTAEGQITFSLVKLASSAKTCIISGGNVFKYNSSQLLVSDKTITLNAKINNVSISEWQYKNAEGNWVKYPAGTGTYPEGDKGETLVVNEQDNVFVNDTATIQLVTSDINVYDIHSITKLRDGAPGDNAVTAVLSNEDQMIAFPNVGSPDYSQAVSQIFIYNGGKVDTQNWTITQSETSNLTITTSKTVVDHDTVAVTAMTGDTGSVTFTCKRSGFADVIKKFSVVKVAQGADGKTPVIYSIVCEALAINKTTPVSGSPVYTPDTVKISAYSQTGTSSPIEYAGRIQIMSGSTTIHSVNTNEKTYTLTSSDMANAVANGYMTVELYQAGGTTKLLDKQTIVITSDGAKGEQGVQGEAGIDAINVVMGNYADVIPCTSTNYPQKDFTIDIPFIGYKGTTQVKCDVATPPALYGVSPTVTQATATAVGHVKYPLKTSTHILNESGTISLTFTCEGKEITHSYTWTRSTAATNGINAKLFELYTIGGNVFTSRDSQDITIYGRLMDGSTDKTTSCTNWTWAKWQDGAYTTISGQTVSSIKINNSTVEGFASYRCTCKYDNVTYTAYYSLIDKLDPIQAAAFCSLGEQIVNGQGVGAFYVIVTDTGTGQELDALKSDRFLTAAPSNPATGDFYYHLDSSKKTVTLKKYTGSAWADASETYSGTYTWTFRDSSGNATTFNGSSSANGKVIYVDGSLVTKKIIADVKVEI